MKWLAWWGFPGTAVRILIRLDAPEFEPYEEGEWEGCVVFGVLPGCRQYEGRWRRLRRWRHLALVVAYPVGRRRRKRKRRRLPALLRPRPAGAPA